MLSYQLTQDELVGMNPDIAIIPVASIEQHGPHLPVNTDVIITEAYANNIAKRLKAFQIPTLPISTCREHMGKLGSVWMNPDTFYAMIKDICMSLKEQGFKKIVIVQGHGGIFVLTPILRELNATKNPELKVVRVDAYAFLEQYKKEKIVDSNVFLHADEFETSLILHLQENLVKKNLIKDYIPTVPREYLNYGSIFTATPSGVWGEPSYASAIKGKLLLERGSELMCEYITETLKFMENKKTQGYSSF